MRTCTEHIISLILKLKNFGVDIDGPSIMFNYNERAMNNSSKIEYTLNNKHVSITYHLVFHNVVDGVVKIGWKLTADNIADAFKNILIEAKRENILVDWTY